MNHIQDRCGSLNQERRTIRSGSKPVNLQHIWQRTFFTCRAFRTYKFLHGVRRIGEDIEGKNMEIRIWTTCILYLCITRRPPNILNSTGPFPKSLGNDYGKQYNLDPKKSFGFDRPPCHLPSRRMIVGGLADRLDRILHCVVAVL